MFAIIETGGKQYKVTEGGNPICVEKLDKEVNDVVEFKVVAISTADGFKVGKPYVEGAKVTATVIEQGKDKKIYVMKYKSKKNEKKKIGHRQPYTKVEIKSIVG